MSTTDEAEVKRIGEKVIAKNAIPLDGPVSGGCHRAATGNIAIFVGGERKAFEKILPQKINNDIFYTETRGMFATAIIGIYNKDTEEMKFVNAGHN